MAATLKDIARQAGLNLSTVSRSLSGSYGVRDETRKRVLEVAERLNYRPNRISRGLVTFQGGRVFGVELVERESVQDHRTQ